jgi:hypothetical protein
MGLREHPVLAVRAVELPMWAMHATDPWLTLGNGKAIAWHGNSQ